MGNTVYVAHGFRSGCEGVTQYFKTEVLARAYAAYLGGSFDGVVMWQHSAEHETGNHRRLLRGCETGGRRVCTA
jgi:hypothetical protein